jgi:hypothetical protein
VDTVLYLVCAVAGWAAFGYKALDLRRDPDNRVLRAMVVAFGSFAAGVSLAVPPLAAAVDHLTGLPNLAKLLAHAGVMSIAAHSEVLLLHLALPAGRAAPRARRRLWASAAAFAVLVALWAATLRYAPAARLTVEYARVPTVGAYLVVYLCAFVLYAADLTRLCRRFARVTSRPWLRRGLRVTATGSAVGLAYCLSKTAYLVAYLLGRRPAGEARLAAVLVVVSALSMIVGLTMPSWGPVVDTGRTWAGRQRDWHRLRPLWRALTRAQPHLVLDPRAHWPTVALRDVDYALHRRITEIRDGRLGLLSYVDATVATVAGRLADADGLTGARHRATVEAARIAAGLRALRAGCPSRRPDRADPYDPPGGYQGEIAWLCQVSRAYATSPVVARTLAGTAGPSEEPAVTAGGGR